jgi:integrase
MESRGAIDTAHRVRQHCGQIFRYAIATGWADRDVSQDLRGAIPPATSKHFAAITEPKAIGALLRGLRVSEAVALRWDQVELDQGRLHVHRLKGGTASTHPLRGPELRALRRLRRDYPDTPYLFVSERGGPITDHTARKLVKRAGQNAGIDFPVHPHMLRHACGYKLANDGHNTRALQHYLGHKNIQHTVRYTELAVDRFKGSGRTDLLGNCGYLLRCNWPISGEQRQF